MTADPPRLHWTEAASPHSARWRSEAGWPPPRRVRVADDTMNADTAYRLACEGTGLLWRGDFQNARQLLQALKRLFPRGSKPAATFFGVIKSKRGTGDFGMVYCYNVPDLVTAALHYAVDQGIDPKLVSNCRYERFERSDVLGLPDKPGSLTLHRVLAALIHPKLFDADFQRDFRRLTGLKPALGAPCVQLVPRLLPQPLGCTIGSG